MTENRPAVTDNRGQHRFEAHLDGQLAGFADYRIANGSIVFPHTVVDPAFGGKGVGTTLVRGALDAVREMNALAGPDEQLTVVPSCSFVRGFIDKNPEYRDLLG